MYAMLTATALPQYGGGGKRGRKRTKPAPERNRLDGEVEQCPIGRDTRRRRQIDSIKRIVTPLLSLYHHIHKTLLLLPHPPPISSSDPSQRVLALLY